KPTSPAGKFLTPPVSYAGAITQDESLGSPTAPVTLAVYSDFQCPYCGQFVRQQFATLTTQFVNTGVLRIEAHDIDIVGTGTGSANQSIELATGARCAAAQNKYWPYHDYVFWNQLTENSGGYTSDWIASIAQAAGVDMNAWNTCVAGSDARGKAIAETNLAHGLGVSSTPSISLNGGPITAGVPAASTLAAQIQALAAAAGVSPSSSAGASPSAPPGASPSTPASP
ncbi:MAG: DsbA family protein, partial [Candidatus Limnocylindrales bacterium]